MEIKDAVAVVTGGASGLGLATTKRLLDAGAQVVVIDLKGEEVVAELGDRAKFVATDVTDEAGVAKALDVAESLGPVRINVNCAGIGNAIKTLSKNGAFPLDGFRKVVEVNLNSLMDCSMKFFDRLKASSGSLITVSSTAAFHATRGNPAYNASKAGAVGLTRTLGQAWAGEGIRVNGIAPGLVDTKLTKVTTDHPERLKATLQNIPAGRLGLPADMAGVALFLASPLAAYVYGQTIPVDGGLIL